jgi:hypothetical protein
MAHHFWELKLKKKWKEGSDMKKQIGKILFTLLSRSEL